MSNKGSGSKDHVVLLSSLPEGPRVVYFSSSTENTRRFVDKVGIPSVRLPVVRKDPPVKGDAPYVLIVPSYGGGRMEPKHAIPKQVMTFLKDPESRDNCVGVISSGRCPFCTGLSCWVHLLMLTGFVKESPTSGTPWSETGHLLLTSDLFSGIIRSSCYIHVSRAKQKEER